ncbi:DUF6624 domain-containing protein [Duganella levis]|uniref:Lysozyme inhibitor LprI N-terminal domain-containing protein n=1 Tax=Duganella levis TaxID=2692169 RepID=A0ABW9VVL1_9BURK|nr:hypothetical protein [Duganella levis]
MKNRFIFLGWLVFALQASAQTIPCDAVSTRLNELAGADQQIRQELHQQTTVAEQESVQKRQMIIDGENLKQLKAIVAACGWPKTTKDSHAAWLLAQHADSDLAFQRRAKEWLEASVKAGVATPRDLAYLADRIAANEGRPQEYGTQFSLTDRCHLVLDPVDDRELVNRRRLAIGLQSLEEYEAEGRRRFIPADCQSGLGR